MKPITLLEHKWSRSLDSDKIDLLDRINNRQRNKILEVGHNKIKARQYVGLIRIGNITIQILPKLCKLDDTESISEPPQEKINKIIQNLLFMLSYTRKLKISETEISDIKKNRSDFFEILIYLFVKNLNDLIQNDLYKKYIIEAENLNYLRGKLLIHQDIRVNITSKHKFFCEFDEFTENNLLNQILKYTIELLRGVSVQNNNQKLLTHLSFIFSDVSLNRINSSHFKKLHFDRLNEPYKPIVDLCQLFIENSSVELRPGHFKTFTFVFDMNKLFEEFIFEFIRRNKDKISSDILNVGHECGYMFDVPEKFQLKPDIVLNMKNGKKIIIDAKYKMLDEEKIHGGISQSDMYQMFTYGSRRFGADELILLYPKSIEISENNRGFYRVNKLDKRDECKFRVHIRQIPIEIDLKLESGKKELINELSRIIAV